MSQQLPALPYTIVVVDIAGFTDPARTEWHQRVVHDAMYRVLRAAFTEADVDLGTCLVEDRGDGALILVPPEVAKIRLADRLPSRLVAGLRRHNAAHSAEAAIQLRVSLHAGEVSLDGQGAVGQAVNLACRLLEASEARSALRLSTTELALITSDSFYHQVIRQDPAADPGSYRQITISVKETSTIGWLCLPGGTVPIVRPHREPDHGPERRVLHLLSATELQRLQEWLSEITVPHLPTLIHRAAGLGVPPARDVVNAWEAFTYLADFNAGADGFPPALMFVELVARQVGDDLRNLLWDWNEEQAHRLRLEPVLLARRAAAAAEVPDSPLHLVIVVQPDGIDPDRYLLSHWRQDDPAAWTPARGETRMVMVDELERYVDDLVVSAERVWSGCGSSVALEFVLPRALLHLPVHRWRKEHDSGDARPLWLDYSIVVRSYERMRSTHWHRVWHQRWQTLMADPSATRVHFGVPGDAGEDHPIDVVLSDPRWVLMVLTMPPRSESRPGTDELTAALRSGLPALVWHPDASSDVLREVVTWLVEGDGLGDLPRRAQDARRAAFQVSDVPFDVEITRDLVILWDDPRRLVALDQPLGHPRSPKEDIADERERTF